MAPAAAAEKIAMTAPVTIEPLGEGAGAMTGAGRWRIHFVMPREYTLASLPRPNNPAVLLRELPARRFAALVFSGFAGDDKVQGLADALKARLKARNLSPVGAPQLARYNPPWTLPFWRRNELLIELAEP
jgi:hypothetical protein